MCCKHCTKRIDVVFSSRSNDEIFFLELVNFLFGFLLLGVGLIGLYTTRLIKNTVLNVAFSGSGVSHVTVDMVLASTESRPTDYSVALPHCLSGSLPDISDLQFNSLRFRIIMKSAVMVAEETFTVTS